MVQVTIFSGYDGPFRQDKLFYITLFAGCDLMRPTIARQTLTRKQAGQDNRTPPRKPFFLTIFGSVDIKVPTLAEEFMDLHQMISAGALTMADWEHSMTEFAQSEHSVSSFTLFGGFNECKLPSENQEIDSLALHSHLGNISQSAGQILQYAIGQPEVERTATIRRAVQSAA